MGSFTYPSCAKPNRTLVKGLWALIQVDESPSNVANPFNRSNQCSVDIFLTVTV